MRRRAPAVCLLTGYVAVPVYIHRFCAVVCAERQLARRNRFGFVRRAVVQTRRLVNRYTALLEDGVEYVVQSPDTLCSFRHRKQKVPDQPSFLRCSHPPRQEKSMHS